jgi:hypothetical protein
MRQRKRRTGRRTVSLARSRSLRLFPSMPAKRERKRARTRSRSFAADQPTLSQFVLLSMLLHVLLIVLFGNPTGSGGRRSEGWWGPLDVTLRSLSPETGSRATVLPGGEKRASDELLRRLRNAAEAPPIERVTPEQTERALAAPVELAPRVPTVPSARLEPLVPRPIEREFAPPVELPARSIPVTPYAPLERIAPPGARRELAPAREVPRREIPAAPTAPLERVAPPQVQRELAPPLALPPVAVPTAPSAPLEGVATPQVQRELAPPVALPPVAVPAAPSAPLEGVATPQVQRELAPPVALPPAAVPAAPSAPLEGVATPQVQRELAPPVVLPPAAVPAAPSAPLERIAPSGIERSLAPPVDVRSPVASPPLDTSPSRGASAPASIPTQPQIESIPSPRFGSPRGEGEIFKPRTDVGAPAEEPRIDLDAARRKAAREIVSEDAGSRRVFAIPSPPPVEKKSKAAMAMEKALKPDCRTAYANLGLLAVPALLASAVADDGGCRW